MSQNERRTRRQAYLVGGPNFAQDWNVWVSLNTYLQLQEGFGWELFSSVFADDRAWGFPISDSVVQSVERHPVWQEDPMR